MPFLPEEPFPPFAKRSDTSREAARSMVGLTGAQCLRVLQYIREAGARGRTCDEVQVELGLASNSATPRIWELEGKYRLIIKSAGTRLTRSGRRAHIYIAKEFAMPACTYCSKSYTNPCDGKDPTCANKKWLDAGNRPGMEEAPAKVKRVPLERKQTRVPLERRPTT